MTTRLPSITSTLKVRWPPRPPTGCVWLRASSTAASTWAGLRTRKDNRPSALDMSPTSIRGLARRSSPRMMSSIWSMRCLAMSLVSASSSKWLPPARSRPRLIRALGTNAGHFATWASGMKLGIASAIPTRQSRLTAHIFQRGKSSMASVVRRLGAVRADFAEHRLHHPDPGPGRDLQLDLILVDLGHLADQAAAGDGDVVPLHRRDHVAMLLHPPALRADEEEVEDDEDEQQRRELHEDG